MLSKSEKAHKNEQELCLVRAKIYDPFLRLLHWWNASAVFCLMITIFFADSISNFEHGEDIIFRLHIYIGYALTAGLGLRVFWGIFGSKHARFSQLFHPRIWITIIRQRKLNLFTNWGHDKYASFLYIVFYILLLYQVVTGFYLAAKIYHMGFISNLFIKEKPIAFGHLLKEGHEFIFYILIVFIFIHIAAIIIHEIKNKVPIAQSMLSGYQYRKKDDHK